MTAFHYTAVNTIGHEQKGVIEADSEKHARQLLREKGLTPLAVRSTRQQHKNKSGKTHRPSITSKELSLMTRQLATLLAAGLPLEEVLAAVAEQTEKPHIQSILMGVRTKVLEGHSIAAGMADFPRAFPHLYRATIAAGEQSGHLPGHLGVFPG